jgi:hypothetical protein
METIIEILNMNVWLMCDSMGNWIATSVADLKFWQLLAGIGLVFTGRLIGYRWSKR